MVDVTCEARDCKYWNYGCKADFTTIDWTGQCLGYEHVEK